MGDNAACHEFWNESVDPRIRGALALWEQAMPDLLPAVGDDGRTQHQQARARAAAAVAALPVLRASDARGRQLIAAGIWLLADDLDVAHQICQKIPTVEGNAWHAVMHRREGDFGNASYWWERSRGVRWASPLCGVRAGEGGLAACVASELAAYCRDGAMAPAAAAWLRELTEGQGGETYDPMTFVELVQAGHHTPDGAWRNLLLRVQRLEWASLMVTCLGGAAKSA